MNRIDRLTAIIIKLQSSRRTSAETIAEQFTISLRTVFRDLKALGEAGVPIGHEPDHGYFIVEGYYLPPIMFTKEEASTLVLEGKFVDQQADKVVADNFNQALLKIKTVLRRSEKNFLEDLDGHISVIKPPMPNAPSTSNFHLTEIKSALVNKNVLSFDYYSNYNDVTTSRTVEPMGLCHYSNHWHLIAYCHLRASVRDFRTDRIMKLKINNDLFDPNVHDDYRKYVGAVFNGTDLEEATVRFNKEIARFIADQKYYYGLINEREQDDFMEMTFMTSQFEYFARWLISFGNGIEIIKPKELKEEIVKMVRELKNHHLS
jgi:predicted DNA-binding transcriptional regulator YafY